MESTTVHLREEQIESIESIVDASGTTGRVPVLQQSEVLRSLVDAGIEAVRHGHVAIERDGEVVASGEDLRDLLATAEQDVAEVEGR